MGFQKLVFICLNTGELFQVAYFFLIFKLLLKLTDRLDDIVVDQKNGAHEKDRGKQERDVLGVRVERKGTQINDDAVKYREQPDLIPDPWGFNLKYILCRFAEIPQHKGKGKKKDEKSQQSGLPGMDTLRCFADVLFQTGCRSMSQNNIICSKDKKKADFSPVHVDNQKKRDTINKKSGKPDQFKRQPHRIEEGKEHHIGQFNGDQEKRHFPPAKTQMLAEGSIGEQMKRHRDKKFI